MEKSYASRTLVQKLGIKHGMNVLLVHEPKEYQQLFYDLPETVTIDSCNYEDLPSQREYDLIQAFIQSQERLQELFPYLKQLVKVQGMIWISWPKGHCDIRSNVNENIVRGIGLSQDFVDIKVVSVNENWSALKFVFRRKDR